MKIVILGANGQVGKVLAQEALDRGHTVIGVTRRSRPKVLEDSRAVHVQGDARNAGLLQSIAASADVVVDALRPPEGQESEHVDGTMAVCRACTSMGIRLVVSGGAGSLRLSDAEDAPQVIDTEYVQDAWRDIAQASTDQYAELLAKNPDGDWTYVAPPAMLADGEKRGKIRKGTDTLVVDAEGQSLLTWPDFCDLIMDEVEQPSGHRRITGGY